MLDPIRGKDRRAEHRFAECPSDRRTFEHPNLDESSQDAVSSLEVLLRCRPDPLRYHIANDPSRLLPGGFGEGEQLLIKEGDRRGTKSVGVDNAQGSVLGSEPAPAAMLALASGNIQRHRHELKFNGFRVQIHKRWNSTVAARRGSAGGFRCCAGWFASCRSGPLSSTAGSWQVMPNFWHLALIEGAIFGPEALKAVGQAFDEAWAKTASHFRGEQLVREGARLALANVGRNRGEPGSQVLKQAGLQLCRSELLADN